MTNVLASVLVLSMLAIMAARAAAPLSAKVTGEVLLDLPVGPMFRMLDQRNNILAILAVLTLGSGLVGERWISHGLFLFAIIAMIGILLVPARYLLTTTGISPNRSTFRAWSDFEGWQARGNVVRIQGTGRFGSLKLYVGQEDSAKLCKVLERYLSMNREQETLASPAARKPKRLVQRKGGAK